MSPTTYLITGANRGLGLGLLEVYLSRPQSTVIAAVRDVNSDTSKALKSVPVGKGSKLILVKIDSASETDAKEAAEELKSHHGITHVDVIIANSGIGNHWGAASQTPAKEMHDHFNVNVVGPLLLFQAFLPLLEASSNPKYFVMSSSVGSISDMEHWPMPATAYGASKAAVNYVLRKIHFENPKIVSVSLHPGWVQTDMGNTVAATLGVPGPSLTLKDSISGLVKRIDGATLKTGGTFASYDGSDAPW